MEDDILVEHAKTDWKRDRLSVMKENNTSDSARTDQAKARRAIEYLELRCPIGWGAKPCRLTKADPEEMVRCGCQRGSQLSQRAGCALGAFALEVFEVVRIYSGTLGNDLSLESQFDPTLDQAATQITGTGDHHPLLRTHVGHR
jgi:hypothetical protein